MKIKKIVSIVFALALCLLFSCSAFAYTAGVEDSIKTEMYDEGLIFTPSINGVFSAEQLNNDKAVSQFVTVRNISEDTTYTISCEIKSNDDVKGINASVLATKQEATECLDVASHILNNSKSTKVDTVEPGEILYVILVCESEDEDVFEEVKNDIEWNFDYVGVVDNSVDGSSGISGETSVTNTETDGSNDSVTENNTKQYIAAFIIILAFFAAAIVLNAIYIKSFQKKGDDE